LPDKFTLDAAHSNVGFSVKHMMVTTVRGRFTEYTGEIEVEGDDPTTARGRVTIKTASIDTGIEPRDAHLRSGDFFDSELYPEMTFVGRKVEREGDGYKVTGDLTIRDVTKPIELTVAVEDKFVDPYGNERIGLSATGTINRTDWGLNWNQTLEAGRLVVAEKVRLEIETALIRPAELAQSA
jgi:polyisoprenoid-binding protein YceI